MLQRCEDARVVLEEAHGGVDLGEVLVEDINPCE